MGSRKNILIWGTGLKGQKAFDTLIQYTQTYNIVAFGDNDKNKVGKYFCNREIIDATKLCQCVNIDMIFLATSAKRSVREQLSSLVSVPIYDDIDKLIYLVLVMQNVNIVLLVERIVREKVLIEVNIWILNYLLKYMNI